MTARERLRGRTIKQIVRQEDGCVRRSSVAVVVDKIPTAVEMERLAEDDSGNTNDQPQAAMWRHSRRDCLA